MRFSDSARRVSAASLVAMKSTNLQDGVLRVTGVGYLRRIKEGTAPGGAPFTACDIFALTGKPRSRELRRIDAIVLGEVAQALIRQCQTALEAGQEILINFCMRDVLAHTFKYSKGKKAGQLGSWLKSNLVWVYWIKVDGEYTFQAEPGTAESEDTSADMDDADDSDDFWL
jgi:Protein of unknown function (DUF3577)